MADWIYYNPNPEGQRIGDCVIRAISAVMQKDWDKVYIGLVMQGYVDKDMPSSNSVWSRYLKQRGFRMSLLPDMCPGCLTIDDFAREHPKGKFILGTGQHAVAVIDGKIYDTWDSRGEIPIYYFEEAT